MKRSTLIVILFVAVILYLLFRAKKASAQVPASSQPLGSAAKTRAPTTTETVTRGVLEGAGLLASMLKSGSPSSVNVGGVGASMGGALGGSDLAFGGSSDWSSVQVSPDFSVGPYSGMGTQSTYQTPDFSSGAFSGSGGWG